MPFNLTIKFSGLCLLVRRKDELLALFPNARHESDIEHDHRVVLGSKAEYQISDKTPVNGHIEHLLGKQDIHLDWLKPTFPMDFSPKIDRFDVVDLKGCGTVDTTKQWVMIRLKHGAACIGCDHRRGAKWRFRNASLHMATWLHWEVKGLKNKLENGTDEGLDFTIVDESGRESRLILRPQNNQLKFYVYNTLADERPSNPMEPEEVLEPGQEAPHFHHYFDLLAGGGTCKDLPKFVCEGSDCSEKSLRFATYVGRRYSCILASMDETTP